MKQDNKYDDLLIRIMGDEYLSNPVDSEFEELPDDSRPWRWEYSHESLTQKNSRFKNVGVMVDEYWI